MELKPGYKQTEVGMIPDDWELTSLGRLVSSIEYGSSAKSGTKGLMPVLRMGNLRDGKIDWRDLVYTDNLKEIAKYALHYGDVLFNRTNTIDLVGKTSIYLGEQPAIFAGYLIRITVNKKLLESRFLNYALNTELAKKYSLKVLSVAVGQANINGQKLRSYPIPLPAMFAEQSAIATALSDVDALLSGLDQLIAKKRDMKQAAMQQLLTGKRRLPGFSGGRNYKQTEVGLIPADWTVLKVAELGEVVTGGTPLTTVRAFWHGQCPWITPTDIIANRRDMFSSERSITEAGLKSIRTLPAGSILVTCIASIGKNAILRIRGSCNQQINAVIPKDSHCTEFLYYLFESSKQYLLANAGTTATSIISKATFQALSFPVPSLSEQQGIAAVLSDMDVELASLKQRRDKTRALKQGMMQELLTGRIRLV